MSVSARATSVVATLGVLVAVMTASGAPTEAASFYFAVDVPSQLGGAEYLPGDIITSAGGNYSLQLQLPAGTALASLHRMADGIWLFSPIYPVALGAGAYEPRDVVAYDGQTFSMFLDGSAFGIPDYARIDALLRDPAGGIILSFDVPVKLAGTEFSRSDLVRYQAGFSIYWDAAAAGVPSSSNVQGADLGDGGTLIVTFDVPTRIGGLDFLPGQLVGWDGAAFSSYYSAGSWPASTQLRDFGFVPRAGTVPDGTGPGEVPLSITPAVGADITLSWGSSCSLSDSDYEIYEGDLGTYYSHRWKFCTTSGALTKTFTPSQNDSYYLVVARNAVSEGSYGLSSDGAQRPPGSSVCAPQVMDTTCHE